MHVRRWSSVVALRGGGWYGLGRWLERRREGGEEGKRHEDGDVCAWMHVLGQDQRRAEVVWRGEPDGGPPRGWGLQVGQRVGRLAAVHV